MPDAAGPRRPGASAGGGQPPGGRRARAHGGRPRAAGRGAGALWAAAACLGALALGAGLGGAGAEGYYKSVFAWGDNRYGELGLGTSARSTNLPLENQCSAQLLKDISWQNLGALGIVKLFSGFDHSAGITGEGDLYMWGRNEQGQLGLGTGGLNGQENFTSFFAPVRVPMQAAGGAKIKVLDVALGYEHTAVVAEFGRVYTFGSNRYGQLGVGDFELPRSSVPLLVDLGAEAISTISAGTAHTLALSMGGAVYSWGANQEGQLGLGGCKSRGGAGDPNCLQPRYAPNQVRVMREGRLLPPIRAVAAGGHSASGQNATVGSGFSLAVSKTGALYSWGDNFFGQLGVKQTYIPQADGTDVVSPNRFDESTNRYFNREELPIEVGMLEEMQGAVQNNQGGNALPNEIVSIATGSQHAVALLANGNVYAWGDNFFGQLGQGFLTTDRESNTRQRFDEPTRMTFFDFNITVQDQEELENGTMVEVTKIELQTGTHKDGQTFVKVAAGKFQSYALTDKGKVYSWGTNSHGEQGTCACGNCVPVGTGCEDAPPAPPPPPGIEGAGGEGAPAPGPDGAAAPLPDAAVAAAPEGVLPPTAEELRAMPPNGLKCSCGCLGENTCVGDGYCVGYGDASQCVCPENFAVNKITGESGTIRTNPLPMLLELHGLTNYTFVDIVSGQAILALAAADCPVDDLGYTCSQIGACEVLKPDPGVCLCPEQNKGTHCQLTCPLGQPDDGPEMEGKVCSGHGTCSLDAAGTSTSCACEENWYGARCNLECPKDDRERYCSGNGTCIFDVAVDPNPFCSCERYNTRDEKKGEANLAKCESKMLYVQPDGWCSYYSKAEGYDRCKQLGQCGLCEDSSPRHFRALVTALVCFAALALLN